MERKILPVEGMMCAGCANTVEKKLKNTQGVSLARVNYATQKATIEFDSEKTSLKKIKKSVEDAGYGLVIDYMTGEEIEEKKKKQYEKLKRNFYVSLLFSIPVFVISMFHISFPYSNYIQGVLTTICLFILGGEFYSRAYKQLKNKSANMDTLVVISTSVACIYSWSAIAFKRQWEEANVEPQIYFETSVVIISFIFLGKLLEEKAKGNTSQAIKKLMGLKPKSALVKNEDKWAEKPLEEVVKGDIILVKSGQKIAVDGVVIQGESYVDESMITGEPMAVKKRKGDRVFSGTINQRGSFQMSAEKLAEQTLLASIIKAVEEAQTSKAPIQRLVDKISSVFVPVVIAIAFITFGCWISLAENSLLQALQSFVNVIVIACPCALGLATPTAIMVGVGKGAENGILIKDAQSLEIASKVDVVVMDKTGTITQGKPQIVEHSFENQCDINVLISIENCSQHPIAKAVVENWSEWENFNIEYFENIVGYGVRGNYLGQDYRVGSLEWLKDCQMGEQEKKLVEKWSGNATLIAMAKGEKIVGVAAVTDPVKENSKKAIEQLKNSGIEVYMITGDGEKNSEKIAQKVGINLYRWEVKPSEKQDFIKSLQEKGKKIAMVGDGINDSQALAQADLSIAMGKGSDIAMDVAQITLMGSDLTKIKKAISLSKITLKTLKENLFWAFIYNVIGIPIAAGVLYPKFGFLLNPMIASLAMVFSSVSVVTNSLRSAKKNI